MVWYLVCEAASSAGAAASTASVSGGCADGQAARNVVQGCPEMSGDVQRCPPEMAKKRRTIRREALNEKITHAESRLRMWTAVLEDARSELEALDREMVDEPSFP